MGSGDFFPKGHRKATLCWLKALANKKKTCQLYSYTSNAATLEALRNALYKCSTYLLTYLLDDAIMDDSYVSTLLSWRQMAKSCVSMASWLPQTTDGFCHPKFHRKC